MRKNLEKSLKRDEVLFKIIKKNLKSLHVYLNGPYLQRTDIILTWIYRAYKKTRERP